jgi:hypothetical protein
MRATLVFPTAEPLERGDLVAINEGGRLVKWRPEFNGDCCLGALPAETQFEADHVTVPMYTSNEEGA